VHYCDVEVFVGVFVCLFVCLFLIFAVGLFPMKLRTSHCAFVFPYCHYSLYKHLFVLRCIFDGAYCLSSCFYLLVLFIVCSISFHFNFSLS